MWSYVRKMICINNCIYATHGFMLQTSDFLLYNNLFIYQVLCTLIYRGRSLYSVLSYYVILHFDRFSVVLREEDDLYQQLHICYQSTQDGSFA